MSAPAFTLSIDELRALMAEVLSAASGATSAAKSTPSEVLTREQTAKLIQVHPNVVSRYVHEHGLPARKVGGEFRFLRSEVLHWIETRERV